MKECGVCYEIKLQKYFPCSHSVCQNIGGIINEETGLLILDISETEMKLLEFLEILKFRNLGEMMK